MKKIFALLVFVCLFNFCFLAQENFSFGGYFSPGITSSLTKSSTDLSWLNSDVKKIEKSAYGSQLGVFAEKKLADKIQISAGLGYSKYALNIDSLEEFGIDKYVVNNRFVQLPILANYAFGSNKYAMPYFSFGYVMHVYLNTQLTYSLFGSNRNETSIVKNDFNTLNHALRIALGYDFVLDKKWTFRAECFGTSFLSSLTNQGIGRRPVSLGLSISLRKVK